MMNKKNKNFGFTLVELLVVIAIIGILAVVAVPSLFNSINKAKVAELLKDYETIKYGVAQYYTDTNGFADLTNNKPHGLLIDQKQIQSYFENEIDKAPFGGQYYISIDKIEKSVIVEIDPAHPDAWQSISTIFKYKEIIEKNSNGNIEVGEYRMVMNIL